MPDAGVDVAPEGGADAEYDAAIDVTADVTPAVIDEVEPNGEIPAAQPIALPQPSANLQCAAGVDDTLATETEVLAFEAPAEGGYFLVVDGYGSEGGVYEVELGIQ